MEGRWGGGRAGGWVGGVGRGMGELQMTSYIHNYLNTSDVAADDPVQPFAEV